MCRNPSLKISSQVTFKYKKKKKAANQRKDLRLLGWRLNPFLPGALSDKLEEKAVIKRQYRRTDTLQVELGKCRGKTNKRLCIAAAACEGDYGAPLIEVPLSLLH